MKLVWSRSGPAGSCQLFAVNHHIARSLAVPRQLCTHPSFPVHSSFTFPSFPLNPRLIPHEREAPPLPNYFPWTCVSLAAGADDLTFKNRGRGRGKDGGGIIASQVRWAWKPFHSHYNQCEVHTEPTGAARQWCVCARTLSRN